MKKMIMSVIMCLALIASTSVMAQDKAPKKDCPKSKTECTKDGEKKACCKDKAAADKKACTKDGEKKACCKDKAAADKKK